MYQTVYQACPVLYTTRLVSVRQQQAKIPAKSGSLLFYNQQVKRYTIWKAVCGESRTHGLEAGKMP